VDNCQQTKVVILAIFMILSITIGRSQRQLMDK